MPPAVSVILPVYNGEQHLREALDSIRRQTFADWELVAVDDGSNDSCPAILQEYARNDQRIRVIVRSENRGITETLNECCHLAAAPLIAVTNQDDVSLPARLEDQVRFLEDHPRVGALGAQAWVIDGKSSTRRLKHVPTDPALASWSLTFFNPMIHPTVMFRTAVYHAVGGYPPGYAGGSEDYAFFRKVAEHSELANLSDPLIEYRIWGGNVTALRWQEQEAHADRTVMERAASLGVEISAAEANALRGLSTGRYPRDVAFIARLAEIIQALLARFGDASGTALAATVKADAASRLWLLAALAGRRGALGVAAKLGAAATRLDALSSVRFVAKAGRRLAGR